MKIHNRAWARRQEMQDTLRNKDWKSDVMASEILFGELSHQLFCKHSYGIVHKTFTCVDFLLLWSKYISFEPSYFMQLMQNFPTCWYILNYRAVHVFSYSSINVTSLIPKHRVNPIFVCIFHFPSPICNSATFEGEVSRWIWLRLRPCELDA